MKEWWINLSLREKQVLCLGSFFLIIFLVYALVWSPLDNKIMTLRKQIVREQKLLLWMQATNQRIQEIEKAQPSKVTASTEMSLLTIVQRQINKTVLVSGLEQLKQADNDSVQLSFKNVSFDKLIEWLTLLWQQQGLVVFQMAVIASDAPGMVSVELVLKRV